MSTCLHARFAESDGESQQMAASSEEFNNNNNNNNNNDKPWLKEQNF
jgi:hypothetical protein